MYIITHNPSYFQRSGNLDIVPSLVSVIDMSSTWYISYCSDWVPFCYLLTFSCSGYTGNDGGGPLADPGSKDLLALRLVGLLAQHTPPQ